MKRIYPTISGALVAVISVFIAVSSSAQTNWNLSLSFSNSVCSGVAVSADGTYMAEGGYPQPIYQSSNSGNSWTTTGFGANAALPPPRFFLSGGHGITMSADGTRIAFVNATTIYYSTNSGSAWNSLSQSVGGWTGIAYSPDGSTFVASSRSGGVWLSSHNGANWGLVSSPDYIDIAMSADGMKMVAAPYNGGNPIYTSTDGGVTWTPRLTAQSWISVASSTNGAILIAANSSDNTSTNGSGRIYVSTDYGIDWTAVNAPELPWQSVACSANGQVIAAVSENQGAYPGQIYVSSDTGNTWQLANAPVQTWQSVAVSGNGKEIIAAGINTNGSYPGVVYTFTLPSTPPTLTMATSGGNAYLLWPNASSGYVLQQSTDLSGTNWVTVTNTPVVVNAVILPMTGSNTFYRLAQP